MRIKKNILTIGAIAFLAVPITVNAAPTDCCRIYIHDVLSMTMEQAESQKNTATGKRAGMKDSKADEYETYLQENLEAQAEDIFQGTESVYNVLLIGTDERDEEEAGRSDSILIASINRDTKQIVVSSLMRDIYCTIPGYGDNRLNAAYAYGGAELLMETIEQNFGIGLSDYASIDFFGFMDVIDAIGGVKAEISEEEIEAVNGYLVEVNTILGDDALDGAIDPADAGTITLNGKQALAFSRIRYVGNSDFDRTGRQREILSSAFAKLKGCSLPEMISAVNKCLPCIETNISYGKMFSLLLSASEYADYKLVSDRLPADGTFEDMNVRGMAVLKVDFSANREHWSETVYGESWE